MAGSILVVKIIQLLTPRKQISVEKKYGGLNQEMPYVSAGHIYVSFRWKPSQDRAAMHTAVWQSFPFDKGFNAAYEPTWWEYSNDEGGRGHERYKCECKNDWWIHLSSRDQETLQLQQHHNSILRAEHNVQHTIIVEINN